jgi:ATP-binding cassette subfamily B protein
MRRRAVVAKVTDRQETPAAKSAPVLLAAQPGGLRMFRDLGWLLGRMAQIVPRAFSLWLANGLLQGLLVPAQLWLTKALIDALARQVHGGAARNTLLWLVLLVASLIVQRVLGGLQPWLAAIVRETTSAAQQERVMCKAASLDLAAFEHQGYYDQLNRVMSGVETRLPRLLQQVLQMVETLPQLAGYTVALLTLSPVLPVIVLAAVVPTAVGFARGGQSNWQLLSAQTRDRRLAKYYAGVLTDRAFAKEVRLYGLSGYLRGRWAALFWRTSNAQRRLALHQGLRQRGMILGMATVSMLGLWWVVAGRLIHTTAGGYALLFQSIEGMIGATFVLTSALSSLGEHSGYASAFRAFLQASPAGPGVVGQGSGTREVGTPITLPVPSPTPDPRPPTPRPKGAASIDFEDVWFTYPGSAIPALAGVTFTMAAGEKVALVGENGAGKTTLAKLLLGLYYPDQGRITLDGVDLREIDAASLRASMSAIFQQFTRYQLTFRENVGLGAPERLVAGQDIGPAVAQAGADDIVRGLAEGDGTLLGPDVGGVDLSGGQWQRVAVARAFFRDAQVLVLDEPTAALDPLAELALFQRFAELAQGKTALLISHRLGMARFADQVLVLSSGKLVAAGRHEELVRAGGEYAELFEAQARWYR